MSRIARQYQLDQFTAVRDAFKSGKKAVIVEAPTGTGKTVSFVLMTKMAMAKKGRVLILLNRDVLVDQTIAELKENDVFAQREQAQERAALTSDIVVASIQSLSPSRIGRWPRDYFRLVILDEAHGSAAPTFKRVLYHFESAYHVGFTATPERHDKKGLWKGYSDIVYSMTLKEAIEGGWLCGFEFVDLDCPVVIDEKLAKKGVLGEDEEVFDSHKYLPRLAECAALEAASRKGLFFLPNCRVSLQFANLLKDRGLNAEHIDSSYMTPANTTRLLEWFKGEQSAILCNSQLLTVGYNRPEIDLIGTFRPFASTPLYKQALGRGTRPIAPIDAFDTPEARREAIASSAKASCKVITPFWENGMHNLASPSCLITDDEEEREMLNRERKAGSRVDMAQMEIKLKAAKTMKDQEEQMRKYAEQVANSQEKKQRGALYIADILRGFKEHHKPASDKYVRFISRKYKVALPPGRYSAYQMKRIEERAEAQQKKAA